jgi:CRISPR-associated endoribonuclease Cas6
MIKQYKIHVTSESIQNFQYSFGYQFYGMLMEMIDTDYAQSLHTQDFNPVNQYVMPVIGKNEAIWTVNLLGEQAVEKFSPVIDKQDSFFLEKNQANIRIISREHTFVQSEKDIIKSAEKVYNSSGFILRFNSPTSFKSNNEYMLFPTVHHIINSLVNKWSSYSKDYAIKDEDAIHYVISGLKILSYRLQSSYYRMKGTLIPGFIGEIFIGVKLPAALTEILKLLLYFANFSGIGIKTSRGMGGISAEQKAVAAGAKLKQT